MRNQLLAFNAIHTPEEVPQHFEEVNFALLDDEGIIRGGILAAVKWNFMHVDILWLDESIRGKGHGRDLLAAVEQRARERGCVCVELDTFSFQAPQFYKQHGYKMVGTVEYLPGKFARHYLVKWLNGFNQVTGIDGTF